jgi:phytoene desaturase
VTVVERESVPGGRAGRLDLGGYRFDTGPTVLTMPGLIADAFACVGEEMADWLELRPVDPIYRAFYPDGSHLDVHADRERMAASIGDLCGGREAAGYLRFADFVSELYRVEMRSFIDRNLDSPLDLLGRSGHRLDGLRLLGMGGFRRLAPKVGEYLRDPRTRRIFSFQSMYAGLAPHEAFALYAVIAYMDSVAGVFFPVGGMHAVPTALAAAAAKHGVRFRYDTAVTSVEVTRGRATAVLTADGERIPADVVVLNPDLPTAYDSLLPSGVMPRRVRRLRYSPSCFLLHVGSTMAYSGIAHHNLHFGRAWRTVFRELIRDQTLMTDPSILVTSPTVSDAALAPAGRHSYYVLVPTPHTGADIDWRIIGPRYRDEIVAVLEGRGYHGFGSGIEVEQIVTPADWEAQGFAAGTPFASAHTFGQTGPFRPANLAPRLENVVFTGSGTQPGVGVPMVLISGRLAAERITGPSHSAGHAPRE